MSKNVASDLLNPNYGARPDDPWARLGIAIVKQACLDYHKDVPDVQETSGTSCEES